MMTGSMNHPRYTYTVSVLQNEKILSVDVMVSRIMSEIFDPSILIRHQLYSGIKYLSQAATTVALHSLFF